MFRMPRGRAWLRAAYPAHRGAYQVNGPQIFGLRFYIHLLPVMEALPLFLIVQLGGPQDLLTKRSFRPGSWSLKPETTI